MTGMLGLDEAAAIAWIARRAHRERYLPLAEELDALWPRLLRMQLAYLHLCGALDESGDTGEGVYDEDDALDALLDGLTAQEQACGERGLLLSVLCDDFLTLFDQYLAVSGLLGD